MKSNLRIIGTIVLISLFLWACPPPVIIDYLTVSVPEEGGMSFTKYTEDHENIIGPYIGKTENGKLKWYAAPLISISPDGEKLAYIAKSNNFNNLYLKNIKGGKTTIQRTFNRNVMDMNYSPDGSHIAFTAIKDGYENIYLINATEGSAIQQLAASGTHELGPTFSADGNIVFFTKQESNRFYIWSINLETALQTQYSEGFTPVLSPDGSFMVVTRNSKDGTRGEIWSINLEKGTETILYSDPEQGFSSPAISPDGKQIVCVGTTPAETNKPQNLDLYIFNINGTGLKQLTFHPGHDVSPQWSPDGESIFFMSQRGNAEGEFNVWKAVFK
jgi:Tol biopolymer transport system component